jgi:hypothetical protein
VNRPTAEKEQIMNENEVAGIEVETDVIAGPTVQNDPPPPIP